jgi:hypothetical protein
MPNEPFIASVSRPGSGPQIRDIALVDFVTNTLRTFYPIIVLGARDTPPSKVKAYTISAALTGTDPNVQKKLKALTLNQVVILLGQFTFTLGGVTYLITGMAPTTGNPSSNGATFASDFADLCLSDIAELLPQASFQVNGQKSYQVSGQPESGVGDTFLTETIGGRSAGYLGFGLNLIQFTLTEMPQPGTPSSSPAGPIAFSLIGNKNHGE